MSCLVKAKSKSNLQEVPFDIFVEKLKAKLSNRVDEAYIFGSYSAGTHRPDSDIDIILVKETSTSFPDRALEFTDLFDLYPSMDIFVYTSDELNRQLNNNVGFWKTVKTTLKRVV